MKKKLIFYLLYELTICSAAIGLAAYLFNWKVSVLIFLTIWASNVVAYNKKLTDVYNHERRIK